MTLKKKFKNIGDDVADVLRNRISINGNRLQITGPRLDPKTYRQVDSVLRELGGKWTAGKVRAHVFESDPTALLSEAMSDGRVLNQRQTYQFFPTPDAVAVMIIDRERYRDRKCDF